MNLLKKKRALLGLAAGILLALGCVTSAFAADKRVFDAADVFTDAEEAELEQSVADAVSHLGMDVAIVTTGTKDGMETAAFADACYEQGGFGVGSAKSGFLYLLDMEGREAYISTAGGAIGLFSDEVVEKALDNAYDSLGSGDYAGSAKAVINTAVEYYDTAVKEGWSYDKDAGTWSEAEKKKSVSILEILLSALIAAAAGGIAVSGVKKKYAMKDSAARTAATASGILATAGAAFAYQNQGDDLLSSHTERRIIPRTQNSSGRSGGSGTPFGHSTTHTSSGGMTHGGGGRKF